MFNRFGFILGTALLLAGSASAATFSANGGAGSSTIGPGDDYATLGDAAADFNGPTPVTGNYTFYITEDNGQITNVYFAKDTAGFTVTIKPSPGTQPVLTFEYLNNNAGPRGHLIIGSLTSSYTLTPTNNFVIDGSNTPGGTTRDLTIRNTINGNFPNSCLIRVVGACDNVQIKNCKLLNNTTSSNYSFVVDFTARNQSSTNYIPPNGLIENNEIVNKIASFCQGVSGGVEGTMLTSGNAQTGLVIRKNNITASLRSIYLNAVSGATINNNTIKVDQGSQSSASYGILHASANGATGWTMDIYNNTFNQLQTANKNAGSPGITAIDTSQNGGTYNIFNNMISGFNFTGDTALDQVYRGISAAGTSPANIYHNSINMPAVAVVTGATAGKAAAVFVASTANVRNNLIKFDQPVPARTPFTKQPPRG